MGSTLKETIAEVEKIGYFGPARRMLFFSLVFRRGWQPIMRAIRGEYVEITGRTRSPIHDIKQGNLAFGDLGWSLPRLLDLSG